MFRWRRHANEFATSRLERQMEEPAMWRNVVSCDQPAVQGNDFRVDSNGNNGKSTFRRWSSRSWLFIDLSYIVREVWGPEGGSRWRIFWKSCLFGKKRPLTETFSKFCSENNDIWHQWSSDNMANCGVRDHRTKFRLRHSRFSLLGHPPQCAGLGTGCTPLLQCLSRLSLPPSDRWWNNY